jgi:hypothetical protein
MEWEDTTEELWQTNTLQSSRKTLEKLGKVSQQQKHTPRACSEGPVPKCQQKLCTASHATFILESLATFFLTLQRFKKAKEKYQHS